MTVMLRTGKGLRKRETIMIRRRQELQVGKRCSQTKTRGAIVILLALGNHAHKMEM